jgi:hypothetical protein
MKSEAAAIAADQALGRAVGAGDEPAVRRALERLFPGHPDLVSLTVRDGERTFGEVSRGRPLDPRAENRFE